MKVLLLQPNPPSPSLNKEGLPLGLACIASFLRKHGIQVRLIDLGRHKIPLDYIPDFVGISASTPYFKNAVLISKSIRKIYPHAKIIFGGDHLTALAHEGLSYADAVVRGEGELAMLEICSSGIKENLINGTPLKELDQIPIPDMDLLDNIYKGKKSRLHMVGARGCPFSCIFCVEHSRLIRYHSVRYFVENLSILARRYHNNILISDDIFTLNKNRVVEICEEIIKRNLHLRLTVFGHINCFYPDLFTLMNRAGITTISYGIESGNNSILKLINKEFSFEQAREVIRKTKEAGFNVDCLYMVGNIGETRETLNDTVNFALETSQQRWCSFAVPFPGTLFYQVKDKYGKTVTEDWNMYTNRNITYVPFGLTEELMQGARNTIMGINSKSIIKRIGRMIWNTR